ncbi:acyltransferase [Dyadobacter sp. CY326]|uniref:acyltransferase family protein n=1 Tax=Dyadobacter sp. CY326 TaxID=2907300 RepID=UPI001F419B12|nr:acyltransferase [Dyadobacter sp. CY326]MCE7067314.1 acyltransferase [Dyadobacter sp. CY326]
MIEDSPRQNIASTRFLELDALRGLAAIMVVVFHFTINSNSTLLGWEFRFGVTGVDIFFMISGFVIFMTISRVRHWPDFLVSRFARLYPAFWCCMLLTALVMFYFEPHLLSVSRLLANVTMASIFFGEEYMDQSYWTLLVELVFYFWIFILLITKNTKNIVAAGLFLTLAILAFHTFSGHYIKFYELATRKIELLNHFPLFFSGILFYLIRDGKNVFRNSALILFSLFAACYLHYYGGRSQYHVTPMEHYAVLAFYHIVFALAIFGKLAFLNKSALLFFGKISYCLYLIHQYVGMRLLAILTDTLHLNIYPALLITIAFVVIIAFLVNKLIEAPANKLIRNAYKKRSVKAQNSSSKEVAVQ